MEMDWIGRVILIAVLRSLTSRSFALGNEACVKYVVVSQLPDFFGSGDGVQTLYPSRQVSSCETFCILSSTVERVFSIVPWEASIAC